MTPKIKVNSRWYEKKHFDIYSFLCREERFNSCLRCAFLAIFCESVAVSSVRLVWPWFLVRSMDMIPGEISNINSTYWKCLEDAVRLVEVAVSHVCSSSSNFKSQNFPTQNFQKSKFRKIKIERKNSIELPFLNLKWYRENFWIAKEQGLRKSQKYFILPQIMVLSVGFEEGLR